MRAQCAQVQEREMNKRKLKQERGEMFGKIIAAINEDETRHGRGGLFNCGELGCCLVFYSRMRFDCLWYELEELSGKGESK